MLTIHSLFICHGHPPLNLSAWSSIGFWQNLHMPLMVCFIVTANWVSQEGHGANCGGSPSSLSWKKMNKVLDSTQFGFVQVYSADAQDI